MATPKAVSSYPKSFVQLLRRASSREIVVCCGSSDKARKLRQRLYAFREAVYRDMDNYPELALLAPIVSFKIDGGNLVARPSDEEIKYGNVSTAH